MARIRLGFALTGSFCTFRQNLDLMRTLSGEYDILPIFSYHAASLDTRFGKAADFLAEAEEICKKPVIRTIPVSYTHLDVYKRQFQDRISRGNALHTAKRIATLGRSFLL